MNKRTKEQRDKGMKEQGNKSYLQATQMLCKRVRGLRTICVLFVCYLCGVSDTYDGLGEMNGSFIYD